MPLNKAFKVGKDLLIGIEASRKWKDESYPDILRRLVEEHQDQDIFAVASGSWWELQKKIMETLDRPIEVIGKPGNGKSHTIKQLITNDKERYYLVIDAHDEYPDLKIAKDLYDAMKKMRRWEKDRLNPNACRFLPDENSRMTMQSLGVDAVSRAVKDQLFELKKKDKLPGPAFVLVVEEAARYSNLAFFGLESRKFCKTILITSAPLYGQGDTLDKIKILKRRKI